MTTSALDACLHRSAEWNAARQPASRREDGRVVPLSQNHPLAVATYQTWTANIPSQYSIDDLLDPALWRNVEIALQARTGRPKPGDLVRCTAADGSYDAWFVIRAVERGYQLVYSHGRLPEVGTL
jgi:hypothetical protein